MLSQESAPDLMETQVMRLLSGVSTHGDQHLAEVERDLVQMDVLLNEAIKKLCASFMAIHHAIDLQQETLKSMLSTGNRRPSRLRVWRRCAKKSASMSVPPSRVCSSRT